MKKQQKKIKKLRHLRKKYRDLINDRIEKIFDFKKKLNAKIIIEKNFKEMKYINFNNDQHLKFIKRVTISINITIFKTTYKISHRNIFIITNFIFNKLKNK